MKIPETLPSAKWNFATAAPAGCPALFALPALHLAVFPVGTFSLRNNAFEFYVPVASKNTLKIAYILLETHSGPFWGVF